MKYLIHIFCALIIIVLAASCKKDFLNVKQNGALNREAYVKDLATVEQYHFGIYLAINSRTIYDGIGAAYPELVADNLKPLPLAPSPGSGTQSLVAPYSWTQLANATRNYNASSSHVNMNSYWISCYLVIRDCSFVIENADKYRDQNIQKADDLKGQALALRALMHFYLVNVFAQPYTFTANGEHPGIPYIKTSDVTVPFSRQSVAGVYDNIEADLLAAIDLLPPTLSNPRYMNRFAAKGLLARTKLFREDFAGARQTAADIITQFPLMTIAGGYPQTIFRKAGSSAEILYQLTPYKGESSEDSRFLGMYIRGNSALYRPTQDIISLLQENMTDVRSQWVTNNAGTWQVTKFPVGVATETPAITVQETSYYPAIVRSSEMFLIAAEASAKTNDETNARNYLDAIRKRANPGMASVTATGTALLDSIYKERRKELCFEGMRMYDLQRLKLGVHRVDVHASYNFAKDLPFGHNNSIAPIPLPDVELAGLQQNPGY